ncbi:molybdate ABC transporter substrate-binding protein [Oceanicella sp. SM1341]|uniref:molybdate ABC transporter substrate-binding protein n=1 Tax=Oceanicella sp. SM1341 TaxID=1548889 RepID=UPI000E538E20|nr:molybdate ABC transporter substrate-binding protein [Oceanicella sp. SM1341]
MLFRASHSRPSHSLTALAGAALLALSAALPARAETALVAVAANFAGVAGELSEMYGAASGDEVTLTIGSTGKLFAQIGEGAPFDAMLSADAATPRKLEEAGQGVEGSRFTYAIGRLALWSPEEGRIGEDGAAALTDAGLRHVAIANPELAPYGAAAREALQGMGLWDTLQPKIVMGQNIGQTHSMVASGAAETGFVALSALLDPENPAGGSRWEVPQELYAPIRQDAVLLEAGAQNTAAQGFLAFLKSPEAQEVIRSYGYAVE